MLSIGIRVLLRGKAHAQLKITKSGERRTVKDDQYIIDEKQIIWGKGCLKNYSISCFFFIFVDKSFNCNADFFFFEDKSEDCESIPIMPLGMHQLPFHFSLPQCPLPCSLETKLGTIRYYIKVMTGYIV